MTVSGAWEEQYVYGKKSAGREGYNYEPQPPAGGNKFIRARLQLKPQAQDADRRHRYSLFQVRLVGDRADGDPAQYHAIATADAQDPSKAIVSLGDQQKPLLANLFTPAGNTVDVVFEVPKTFTPRFVEYKAGARQTVVMGTGQPPAEGEIATASRQPTPEAPGASSSTGGRVAGVRPTGSFFGDSFPGGVTMTRYRDVNLEVNSSTQRLQAGHIHGVLRDQGREGGATPISGFDVPPGKQLLHLNVVALKPASVLGRALDLVITTMKNYVLTDDKGQQYLPVGAYIISMVGFNETIEIQYYADADAMAGRTIGPWARLKKSHVQRATTYMLLYLVEPGTRLVSFSTGGSAMQAVDLSEADLVAPGEAAPQRAEITLAPDILRRYVGKYRLETEPGTTTDLEITLEDGKLMAELSGQPKVQIYAESETKFFYKVIDAQITFVTNRRGRTTGLILHQGGTDVEGEKVN
jgi:hypothetical protein